MATNVEDLKLIASYMDAHWDVEVNGRLGVYNNTISAIDYYLDYDKDWNLLMDVVDSFNKNIIRHTLNGVVVTIGKSVDHKQYCYIEFGNMFTQTGLLRPKDSYFSQTFTGKTKKEATLKAVIAFINWIKDGNNN